MLTQAIQKLIDEKIDPTRVFYVAVDTPTYTGVSLEQLLLWFMEIHGHERADQLYVFFDEIQYHPDWERHLKSLVDSFPAMRFVASGSAAAALKMKSIESGAGRFTDFLLPPLNFAEFLRFTNIEEELTDYENNNYDIDGLNKAFVDYVNFGAFPEAVLKQEVRAHMDRFVANDIVDKVLLRDLPSLYGIADTQELKRFFTVLAYNTGEEVSLEGLAQASGVAKNTLRKYLDYLEAAFLIHRLHRIDRNARRFKRVTHFKVYLTNPCIRAALFGPVTSDSQAMGHLAETAYVAQMSSSFISSYYFYARWSNGEVDLVSMDYEFQRPASAEEIKWSDRSADHPQEELKSLISFCKKNGIPEAFVFGKSRIADVEIQGVKLMFRALSVRCYTNARFYFDDPIVKGLDPRTFLALGSQVTG
jgi:predicted AAA+ superfamily ATPase